ncbi:unnamed protein product [Pylaiella littoralis]
MASCYGSISQPLGAAGEGLQYLPVRTTLPDGTPVEIDYFRESEHAAGHRLLNGVIEEGLSWPFEETLDMDAFRAYFLSHAAFVVRTVVTRPTTKLYSSSEAPPSSTFSMKARSVASSLAPAPAPAPAPATATATVTPTAAAAVTDSSGDISTTCSAQVGGEEEEEDEEEARVWGVFYIKPNFPGRCSHVCNGGFITDPRRRRRGVARLMGHAFLRLAKDLGYRASYFNLVFRSNESSLRLWRGLGFTELAVVPRAGRLKGIDGLVDAIQFHYDLDTLRPDDLPEDLRGAV